MKKLVVDKDEKGFDVVECQLVIHWKMSFQIISLLEMVQLWVLQSTFIVFKEGPQTLYIGLSRIYIRTKSKKIMQCNKFDMKVPIFVIPKDPKILNIFNYGSLGNGRIYKTISF